MAKTVKKDTNSKKASTVDPKVKKKQLKQYKLVFGILLILLSLALLLAFISFYIYGTQDQSTLSVLNDRSEQTRNWLGKVGAYLADLFIYKGFGVASFLFVKLFFLTGLSIVLDVSLQKLKLTWFWDLFALIIISVFFGFFATSLPELATSAVAAFKRNSDIALGNVIGSNIFNVFFILSSSAIIRPLPAYNNMYLDLIVVALGSLLVMILIYSNKNRQINRWGGVLLLVAYFIYIVWMISSANTAHP